MADKVLLHITSEVLPQNPRRQTASPLFSSYFPARQTEKQRDKEAGPNLNVNSGVCYPQKQSEEHVSWKGPLRLFRSGYLTWCPWTGFGKGRGPLKCVQRFLTIDI